MKEDLLLLSTPRCGSDYFSQWLLKLYSFGWIGEWLAAGSLGEVKETLALPDDWTLADFVERLREAKSSEEGRVAIKIMWDTFAWTQWKGRNEGVNAGLYACLRSPFLVLLSREDKIAQAVSLYKARKSGLWHGRDAVAPEVEVEYDQGGLLAALLEIISGEEAWKAWLRGRQLEYQVIRYETFVRDPKGELGRLLGGFRIDESRALAQLEDPPNQKLSNANSRALRRRFLEDRPDLVRHTGESGSHEQS